MAEVDAFAKAFLPGQEGPMDNRPKASPAVPVQPLYKEPDEDEFGSAPGPVLGEAAASSSGEAQPPRPDGPGSPAPEAGAPSEPRLVSATPPSLESPTAWFVAT